MNIEIANDALQCIVDALRYYCHMEAGHSQEPNLRDQEDYYEWTLADRIEKSLRRSNMARARHEGPSP